MKAKYRLFQNAFKGPGPYAFKADDKEIIIEIDEHGVFDVDGEDYPFHVFANIVGGSRDWPY